MLQKRTNSHNSVTYFVTNSPDSVYLVTILSPDSFHHVVTTTQFLVTNVVNINKKNVVDHFVCRITSEIQVQKFIVTKYRIYYMKFKKQIKNTSQHSYKKQKTIRSEVVFVILGFKKLGRVDVPLP